MAKTHPLLKHSGLEMTHIPSTHFPLVRTGHMVIAGLEGGWELGVGLGATAVISPHGISGRRWREKGRTREMVRRRNQQGFVSECGAGNEGKSRVQGRLPLRLPHIDF